AIPGLNAALTRVGSLSGAVAVLRDEQRAAKAPGSAVEGLAGGMGVLVDALRADLETYGAEIRTGVRATGLVRDGDGWRVTIDAEDADEPLSATGVVVAAAEPAARELLAPHIALGAAGASPEIEIVTLLLDAPELDAAP